MDVFRFGEQLAVPDGDLRLSPLTGDDVQGALRMAYLEPGGRLRRTAPSRTLLAVVTGSGWASGDGDRRRELGAGHAVVWDAGELQELATDDGLTAVVLEGSFSMRALRVTREIAVHDPDPAWPAWFEQVQARVWPAVQDVALRIDHVGSTSVPGLAAKPIIDLDVVVASADLVEPAIERLASLGYRWRGDLGIAGRDAFETDDDALPAHHLYLVVEGNRAHLDHVLLRDLLRQDPVARQRYADLKRANVELAAGDIDVYVAAKARLVAELLTRARAERGLPPVDYWDPEVPGRRKAEET